jgi:hypothetical protein
MRDETGRTAFEAVEGLTPPSITGAYVELNDNWWYLDREKSKLYFCADRHNLLESRRASSPRVLDGGRSGASFSSFDEVFVEEGILSVTRSPKWMDMKVAIVIFDEFSVCILPLDKELLEDENLGI